MCAYQYISVFKMREWYLSSELVGLDGMANSVVGVSQKAKRNNWLRRKSAKSNNAFEYHISNFHPDIKKQVIEKYVTNPEEAKALFMLEAPTPDDDYLPIPDVIKDLASREPTPAETETFKKYRAAQDKVVEMPNVGEVKSAHQMDMCGVPVYNVYAACGWGAENGAEHIVRTEFLPCQWLSRFGLTEDTAKIITCKGDSMEDTLSNGDEVLVDTRELEHPVNHGVYVVRIGKHVYVKRLKYDIMAEGYEVISDNKEEYNPFIVNGEKLNEFAVIGKVVTTVMKAVV